MPAKENVCKGFKVEKEVVLCTYEEALSKLGGSLKKWEKCCQSILASAIVNRMKARISLYWGLIGETREGYTVKDFPFLSWNVILYFIGLLRGSGPRLAILRIAIHWKGTDLQNFYWFKWELMHVTTSGSRGNDDNSVLIFFPISNKNLSSLKHSCFSVEIIRLYPSSVSTFTFI